MDFIGRCHARDLIKVLESVGLLRSENVQGISNKQKRILYSNNDLPKCLSYTRNI